MTDSFTLIDAGLWAAAVVLGTYALWLTRPRVPDWEPDAFFAAVWSTLRRPAPLPLTEGPIPDGGWEGDGAELGEAYDPARRLGPAAAWDALPGWSEDLRALVRRRLEHLTVVWVGAPAVEVPEVATRVAPDATAVDATLDDALPNPQARLVLATREAPGVVLRRLHAEPGLRDRVRAVVFVGAELDTEREWLATNFTHVAFDLELARRLPFLVLRTAEGAGQRLRPPPATTRDVVWVLDLGRTEPDALADPTLGRALALTLAALEA